MLERVQKRATKSLSQHRHLSYTGRLKVYKAKSQKVVARYVMHTGLMSVIIGLLGNVYNLTYFQRLVNVIT